MIDLRYCYRMVKGEIIKRIVIKPLLKLGFINYKEYRINGDKNRLIFKNPKNVALANTLFNTRSGTITIGDGVVFGHNVMILTGRHNYEAKDVKKLDEEVQEGGYDIIIGDGTWITSGSIIVGQVTIGEFCVIAAGSVVTKDVPDYSFVAGVPAKVIKNIR